MEDLISPEDLIKLGFYKDKDGQFMIGNSAGDLLTLKKHSDIISWYVTYNDCQLFITSYTVKKLTHLLKGMGMLAL